MKYVFLSVFGMIMVLHPGVFAQKPIDARTTIWINRGEKISGILKLKEYPFLINIYQPSGDSIGVPVPVIEKIMMTPVMDKKSGERRHASLRYFNQTYVGILSGRTNEQVSYRSLINAEIVNGLIINQYFWPGVGIGFDQYQTTSIMPVYISVTGDLFNNRFTPFYFVNAGTGPAWETENSSWTDSVEADGKFMYHIGMGVKMYSDHRVNVNISMGYKHQEIDIIRSWTGTEEITSHTFRNLSFRIGVGF